MIDFDALVLGPCLTVFARPIYVTPQKSQPGQPSYWARGDYRVENVDVPTHEGVLSETTLTLRVRVAEFLIPAGPQDQVYVPAQGAQPAAGPFWIDDTDDDAEGHSVWALKAAKPTTINVPVV